MSFSSWITLHFVTYVQSTYAYKRPITLNFCLSLQLPDHKCIGTHKPRTQETCNTVSCPMWETDKWSEVRVHAILYAIETHRLVHTADAGGDAVSRSYHLRAETLSLLAAITDLGARVGSSRKHITHTYGAAFAIYAASFTAEHTTGGKRG